MTTAKKTMGTSGKEIEDYTLKGEEIAYSFKHRSTGLLPWLKSLLGYGESHWYVTDDRLIKYDKIAGEFGFREVSLENITSVEYGRQIDLPTLVLGLITAPFLIGVLITVIGPLRATSRPPSSFHMHIANCE